MRLGEILVAANACDEEAITKGLEHSRFSDNRLGSSLIELGLVSSDIVAAALGKQHGISPAKEANFQATTPDIIALLTATEAYARKAVPLGIQRSTGQLAVAMLDPADLQSIDALKDVTGKDIIVAAASERRIRQGLLEHYGAPEALPIVPEEESFDLELADVPKLEAHAPVPLQTFNPPAPAAATEEASKELPQATVAKPKFDLREFLGTGRGIVVGAVALVAFLAVAKFAYDWITDKDIPVSGSFEASHVNLELTLPKTGWIYAPSADVEESKGPVTVSVAMLYRGKNIKKPDDALWLMNVSGPMPAHGSQEQLEAAIDDFINVLNNANTSQFTIAGFTVQELSCERSYRRPGVTAGCLGSGYYQGINYQLSVFIWQESNGSVVAAAFLTQTEFTSFDDEIDSILASIRLL
tara:strand:+ start:3393 stop:4631 length:1239 start_codon:yes stop_codon:yes gene_type:complete